MDDLVSRQAVKDGMHKYGFRAPDMTVNEFVEDCLPAASKEKIDQFEYENILLTLIKNEKGYDAIIDLTRMLSNYSHNTTLALKETVAEKRAILKILDSDTSNKNKLEVVRNMFT